MGSRKNKKQVVEKDIISMDKWFCEDHPECEMGHNGCEGAGIPEGAQMFMLVIQRRNAIQKYKEVKYVYEDMVHGLLQRIEDMETNQPVKEHSSDLL